MKTGETKKPGFWKWLYLLMKGLIQVMPEVVRHPVFEFGSGMLGFALSGVLIFINPLLFFIPLGFFLIACHGVYRE